MRYGFKAQAERLGAEARIALGLDEHAPLNPFVYADYLGVIVLDFHTLGLSQKSVQQLLHVDPESWSGMTINVDGTHGIVINPSHNRVRQNSDLAHELAHCILRHQPASVTVSPTGLFMLSEYSDDLEAEADWLAAALLLPRQAILIQRHQGLSAGQIAGNFQVSLPMCEWRLRMTGVEMQLRRRRA